MLWSPGWIRVPNIQFFLVRTRSVPVNESPPLTGPLGKHDGWKGGRIGRIGDTPAKRSIFFSHIIIFIFWSLCHITRFPIRGGSRVSFFVPPCFLTEFGKQGFQSRCEPQHHQLFTAAAWLGTYFFESIKVVETIHHGGSLRWYLHQERSRPGRTLVCGNDPGPGRRSSCRLSQGLLFFFLLLGFVCVGGRLVAVVLPLAGNSVRRLHGQLESVC